MSNNNQQLSLAVIGGLGLMASPMAVHLGRAKPAYVVRYLDRGTTDQRRDEARRQWVAHGARPSNTVDALIGKGSDIDGVVICAGKNGDDAQLVGQTAELLQRAGGRKFICHMSTVSTAFPVVAQKFCTERGVQYFSCPLTGGPMGARAATMLMLASGEKALYDKLLPMFECLGKPKFFGERIDASAEVKLIGHLMVFNGLMGISSAVATHAECFHQGKIGGSDQVDFFDFLNSGGGGTKQWDLFMRPGVNEGRWEDGFLIKHAATDTLYAAKLCVDKGLTRVSVDSMLNVALLFSYVLNSFGDSRATQSVVLEFVSARKVELDQFIEKNGKLGADVNSRLAGIVQSLPDRFRRGVVLDIKADHFGF